MIKFDLIIMNPPYERDLHLKILEEAISNHLKDDKNSVCVNLSPVVKSTSIRNLYDEKTITKHKKFSILKYLKDVEVIKSNDSKLFNDAGIQQKIGIQTFSLNNKSNEIDLELFVDYDKRISKDLIKKIMTKCMENSILKTKMEGDVVLKISGIHGHIGENDFYDIMSPSYTKQLESSGKNILYFKSENDRKDFHTFWLSPLGKFLVSLWKIDTHVMLKYIPYIWFKTDEEFVEYFKISNDEFEQQIEIILNNFK